MKTKLKTQKTIRTIFAIGGFLSLWFLTQLSTLPVSAADPEEPTITIDTISDTANLSIAPTSTNGTFTTSVDSDIVFNVSTNNFSGYSLSVTTSDNSPSLLNGASTINTIDSALTAAEFNSSANNNKWGFKPNKFYDTTTNVTIDNSGEEGVFLPAPTSATQLDKTTAANSDSNAYSISVGLRVNLDANAGEYSGTLNIISVANPVAYIIGFDNNVPASETVINSPENVDGMTFGSNITLPDNVPTREHYSFTGWCNITPANSNGTDTCAGENAVSYQPGDSYNISHLVANDATLYAMWQIDTFTQTTKYRFENEDDSFTDWIDAETVVKNYGDTYSWNQDSVSGFQSNLYDANGVDEYVVEGDKTNEVTFMRQYYTCYYTYRLEDADGNYPDEYSMDGYGVYKKGVWCWHQYLGLGEYQAAMLIAVPNENYHDEVSIDQDLARITRNVTLYKHGDITEVIGSGTYRAGQKVTFSAIKPENTSCRSYSSTTWVRSTGNGGFVNGDSLMNAASGDSVEFMVQDENVAIAVTANHTDIKQTISFSAPNGETITFDGVDYQDGDSTQAYCGTYDISSTIKEQPVEERIYLQDITPATCPITKTRVYDRRDNESYYIQKLADGNCWMLDNLRVDYGTTLTTTDTHMSPVYNFQLPEASAIGYRYFGTLTEPRIVSAEKYKGLDYWWQADEGTLDHHLFLDATFTVTDSATLTFGEVPRVGVYYNFCAATAGTFCKDHDGNHPDGFVDDGHVYDVCPAGWRLPVGGAEVGEFTDLISAYDSVNDFEDAFNVRLGSGVIDREGGRWNQGGIGYYWSSTAYMDIYGYFLNTWKGGGARDGSNERNVGQAVRCMMETPQP